jgi:hypothetical protein
LLPDIPGVTSVRQQVDIAARKAGIVPGEPLKLSRFRVDRYREKINRQDAKSIKSQNK